MNFSELEERELYDIDGGTLLTGLVITGKTVVVGFGLFSGGVTLGMTVGGVALAKVPGAQLKATGAVTGGIATVASGISNTAANLR